MMILCVMLKLKFSHRPIPMPQISICRDEKGFGLVLTALTLPILIGLGALALDFGFALSRTRQMQVAADAAAFSGASAIVAGFDPLTYGRFSDEVYSSAATASFKNGVNGITVTPSYNANTITINGFTCAPRKCVTATIKEQRSFSLLGFFNRIKAFQNLTGNLQYQVTATAMAITVNQYCMIATANSAKANNPPYSLEGAVKFQGNTTVDSPSCGIADNSTSEEAFQTIGSSFTLNAPVSIVGGWDYNGNPPQFSITYGTPVLDPYLSNSTLQSDLKSFPSGNVTLAAGACPSAGVHYKSVSLNNAGTCTLSAGTYYFDSITKFQGTTWTGSDVTIIIGPNGKFDGGAQGNLNINAPTSGTYSGVAVTSLSPNGASFGANEQFGTNFGALYWPNGPVTLQGTPSGICLQVIADKIELAGNSSAFNQNCIANPYQIQRNIVQLIN